MKNNYRLKSKYFNSLNYFQIEYLMKEYGMNVFPYKYLDDKGYISEIEKAVGINLSNTQIDYILGRGSGWYMNGRCNSNFVTKCIKLLLTEGKSIDMKACEIVLINYTQISEYEIKRRNKILKEIHFKLKERGFVVNDIIPYNE
jgi:hypothetical protein